MYDYEFSWSPYVMHDLVGFLFEWEKMSFHELCYSCWYAFSLNSLYASSGELLNLPKCSFDRVALFPNDAIMSMM